MKTATIQRKDIDYSKPSKRRRQFTEEQRLLIFLKFNGHCAYCGKELELENYEVDHIKPLSSAKTRKEKGSLESINNLFPSCAGCNRLKKDKTLERFKKEYRQKKGMYFDLIK